MLLIIQNKFLLKYIWIFSATFHNTHGTTATRNFVHWSRRAMCAHHSLGRMCTPKHIKLASEPILFLHINCTKMCLQMWNRIVNIQATSHQSLVPSLPNTNVSNLVNWEPRTNVMCTYPNNGFAVTGNCLRSNACWINCGELFRSNFHWNCWKLLLLFEQREQMFWGYSCTLYIVRDQCTMYKDSNASIIITYW